MIFLLWTVSYVALLALLSQLFPLMEKGQLPLCIAHMCKSVRLMYDTDPTSEPWKGYVKRCNTSNINISSEEVVWTGKETKLLWYAERQTPADVSKIN